MIEAPSLNSFKNRLDHHWKNNDEKYNFKANHQAHAQTNQIFIEYSFTEELAEEAETA